MSLLTFLSQTFFYDYFLTLHLKLSLPQLPIYHQIPYPYEEFLEYQNYPHSMHWLCPKNSARIPLHYLSYQPFHHYEHHLHSLQDLTSSLSDFQALKNQVLAQYPCVFHEWFTGLRLSPEDNVQYLKMFMRLSFLLKIIVGLDSSYFLSLLQGFQEGNNFLANREWIRDTY